MKYTCEICGRPDYVECDWDKHEQFKALRRAREIAKEDPEELLP
jgi:hypothetical protein